MYILSDHFDHDKFNHAHEKGRYQILIFCSNVLIFIILNIYCYISE